MIESDQYDAVPRKFTGKERDYESGLDNFGARFDSSSFGRFMTPDWSITVQPVPYAKLALPQSMNLYSYVENNPVTAADEDGHESPACMWGGLACLDVQQLPNHGAITIGLAGYWGADPQQQAAAAVARTTSLGTAGAATGTGAAAESGLGATLGEALGPGTLVVASAWLLITRTTDALIENAQGQEQLAAIESLVAVENHINMAQNTGQQTSIIAGLLATAATHLEKIASADPNDPNRKHWKKEVKAALNRATRVAKRLPGKAQDTFLQAIENMQKELGNL